jgi:hypothetical protein
MRRNKFFKHGFPDGMLRAPAAILKQGGIAEKPTEFQLGAPFPYPFYSVATIPFSLPREGQVRLELFDAAGTRLHTLLNGQLQAGNHRCFLDADELKLSTGSYICLIHWHKANEEASAFQMISIP